MFSLNLTTPLHTGILNYIYHSYGLSEIYFIHFYFKPTFKRGVILGITCGTDDAARHFSLPFDKNKHRSMFITKMFVLRMITLAKMIRRTIVIATYHAHRTEPSRFKLMYLQATPLHKV